MSQLSQIIKFPDTPHSTNMDWLDSLFNIGQELAQLEKQKKRATVFLILPTLDMATSIISLGYLYKNLKDQKTKILGADYYRHLPAGTPVIYTSTEGPQQAVFFGPVMIKNDEYFSIRVHGHSKILLPSHGLGKLMVLSEEKSVPEHHIGKNVTKSTELNHIVFGNGNAANLSRIIDSIWMIGRPSELEYELRNRIVIAKYNNRIKGSLSDLLKVEQFLKPRDPSFSKLISCFRNDLEYAKEAGSAKLAIFRESVSYIKHQHNYKNASKIVLLEFSDHNLELAINDFNQRYYDRGSDLSLASALPDMSHSAFLEAA